MTSSTVTDGTQPYFRASIRRSSLHQSPVRLDKNIILGKAEEADIKLDPDCKGGADGYIDDGAVAVLDSPGNSRVAARADQAVVMVVLSLSTLFMPRQRVWGNISH